MNWDNLKFRINRESVFNYGFGLKMWVKTDSGAIVLPEPITWRTHQEPDRTYTERGPDITLSRESAQQLMDELWDAGLRPSEGSGSAGSLAATQRHLADMRALTAKALQTELPK